MDRLFPGHTEEGHAQAALGAAVGGLGWRRATDSARPANLAALLMAAPAVGSMAEAATRAGLLRSGTLEASLDVRLSAVRRAYLDDLDELEKVKAEDFISRVTVASAEAWQQVVAGAQGGQLQTPRADTTYAGIGEHAPAALFDDGVRGRADVGPRGVVCPQLMCRKSCRDSEIAFCCACLKVR